MTDEAKDTGKAPESHEEANSNPGKLTLKMLAENQNRMADATDGAISDLRNEFSASLESLQGQQKEMFEVLRGMSAESHPSGTREFDSPDARENLPSDVIMGEDLMISQRTDVDSPAFKSKSEAMRFMEEPVTIFILPTSEDQAAPIFSVYVNRLCVTLERGKTYTLPRKFVETLARAKPLGYTQQRMERDIDGPDLWRNRRSTGLRYPFQVQLDKNPHGEAWLRGVLAED